MTDNAPPIESSPGKRWYQRWWIWAIAAVIALAAIGGSLGDPEDADDASGATSSTVLVQDTTSTTAEPTTTTEASTTTTTTAPAVTAADIPQVAAGCVGYVDGLWQTDAVFDGSFDELIARELTECWTNPPDRIAEEADAYDAYCVGMGAGAFTGGDTAEEANELFGICLSDRDEEAIIAIFLPALFDRASLLESAGVEEWLASYGPAE